MPGVSNGNATDVSDLDEGSFTRSEVDDRSIIRVRSREFRFHPSHHPVQIFGGAILGHGSYLRTYVRIGALVSSVPHGRLLSYLAARVGALHRPKGDQLSVVASLAQSRTGQRQLRLLQALTELEPLDNHHQVHVRPLRADSERWGLDAGAITSDLRYLQSLGMVECFESVAGINNVFVKQPGLDTVEEFRELRSNLRRRAQELRDIVLNWLYDEQLSGGKVKVLNDFLNSPRNQYLGDPFTEEELWRAGKWLLDQEYIDGMRAYGNILARPIVTTKGINVIETEQSVNKALNAAGVTMNNVTITGSQSVNVAVGSNNVTQSNSLTQGQIEQVEKILGSVRAMLNPAVIGVTQEVATEAQTAADEVEQEIHSPAPDGGKVKALLMKLADLAATGTVQGGVDALNALMQQGIAGIG